MSGAVETTPLHPLERLVLKALFLGPKEDWVGINSVVDKSGISLDQARRALEWLKSKSLVEVSEEEKITFSLGPEGEKVAREGLPERRVVRLLEARDGKDTIGELAKSMKNEFTPALGKARKNGWVVIKGNNVLLTTKAQSKEAEELLIEKLSRGLVSKEDLVELERETLSALSKRQKGFVEEKHEKTIYTRLSSQGRAASSSILVSVQEIDAITPKVLQTGEWKQKPLRALDVTSPAPSLFAGRRHPMRLFMDEVREAFVSLGFEEILGPLAQSALWNFDALFIPQAHPAREMQDTFYMSGLKARLDDFKEDIEAIKAAHENGAKTGSLGWQYKWKLDEASRVVLRTHTTAVTISYLAKYKPEEARVFSVGRVFRNEKANYKHNPEFYQIEGVMVGPTLNLRGLIYIISKFYSKLGFDKIKFWPTYFPYTEPSLQTMVFHEQTQRWMELGGMGIFRPEVTLPLGVKNPVLAWGLSLDRLVMLRHGVKDIRELFGSNLFWLRNSKVV